MGQCFLVVSIIVIPVLLVWLSVPGMVPFLSQTTAGTI